MTTIQFAGALGEAPLGSVGFVAEHLFGMSTVQLHRGLHHTIIVRITTVSTTDSEK